MRNVQHFVRTLPCAETLDLMVMVRFQFNISANRGDGFVLSYLTKPFPFFWSIYPVLY